ncbi:unnamed protein product [Lymnaea stagnalis]|uniref:C-type lectin domain-containing protein n=1 Tax=Lymnaea stagnalis TaxID=6523 RepID=A0AAV2IL11_LYMST
MYWRLAFISLACLIYLTDAFGRYRPYRTRLRQCLAREKALYNERTQYLTQISAVRDELWKINEARGNLFHGALHYGGHRYYASKFQFETVETAQAICQSTGGYLVELNNAGEYYAFRNYIIGLQLRAESVLLGGTDQAHEGTWVFQHSGRYIPYFDWIAGEPNNWNNEDCMSLWLSRGARMNDIHCWRVGPVVHFACEVPSSADW